MTIMSYQKHMDHRYDGPVTEPGPVESMFVSMLNQLKMAGNMPPYRVFLRPDLISRLIYEVGPERLSEAKGSPVIDGEEFMPYLNALFGTDIQAMDDPRS